MVYEPFHKMLQHGNGRGHTGTSRQSCGGSRQLRMSTVFLKGFGRLRQQLMGQVAFGFGVLHRSRLCNLGHSGCFQRLVFFGCLRLDIGCHFRLRAFNRRTGAGQHFHLRAGDKRTCALSVLQVHVAPCTGGHLRQDVLHVDCVLLQVGVSRGLQVHRRLPGRVRVLQFGVRLNVRLITNRRCAEVRHQLQGFVALRGERLFHGWQLIGVEELFKGLAARLFFR